MSDIELAGLERRYGERTALAGVTVSVPTGATLAVFGSNGAGKTRVLVSHDVERTLAEADVAVGLRAGHQQFAGRVEEADVRRLFT